MFQIRISRRKTLVAVLSLAMVLAVFGPVNNLLAAERLVVGYTHVPPITGARADHPDEKGLLIELYERVLPTLGYDPEFMQLPPARLANLMEKGQRIDLYVCASRTRTKRPSYVFGDVFVTLNIELFQIASETKLQSFKALKDQTVLKQHGYSSLKNVLDKSNSFIDVPYESLVPMFARRRAPYLIGFRERLKPLMDVRIGELGYRSYNIKTLKAHLCLRDRFPDTGHRVKQIHEAVVAYQNTPDGADLFKRYMYESLFGAN